MHAFFQYQAGKEENVVIQHFPETEHFKKEDEQFLPGIISGFLVSLVRNFSGN